MVMKRYKVELREGWTKEKVWDVIDKSETWITLAPVTDVPLVFKRRDAI